jgi:hypothetical protein
MISQSSSQQKIPRGILKIPIERLSSDIRQIKSMPLLTIVDQNIHLTGCGHGRIEALVQRLFVQLIQYDRMVDCAMGGRKLVGHLSRAAQVSTGYDNTRARFCQCS